MKKVDVVDIVDVICRVLLVLCTGVNAGLYFSAEKIILGILWSGLSIAWVGLLVDAIKKLRGR